MHAIKFKIFVQQLYGFIKPNGAVTISCVLISTAQKEGEKLAYRNTFLPADKEANTVWRLVLADVCR